MKQMKSLLCLFTVLAASLSTAAATWDKPVPNTCTPETGGTYYLYDYADEKFVDASELYLGLSEEGSPVEAKV